jgi:hypothetical protein
MEAVGALSAVVLVSSLLSFSASSLLLVQNYAKSRDTLLKLQRETLVLQHVLDECYEIVATQQGALPKSLESSLLLCDEHRYDLLRILDKIFSKKRRVERALHISFYDQELMASFNSFRDAVLLLRDITSE